MRTIDINDWIPFGEGGFGESYYHKSDRSIMLKMYMKDTDSVLAEREFERARAVLEMRSSINCNLSGIKLAIIPSITMHYQQARAQMQFRFFQDSS